MPRRCFALFLLVVSVCFAATPVTVTPVTGKKGMVVAGHPQAAEAGLAILKAGGNALDAAVATSLALGVAEPYGSGLGGKMALLYYEARTGKVYAVDGMDAAGSLDVAAYLKRPEDDRSYGYGSVCVPGLGAALWAAHQKWGSQKWADVVQPAIVLARTGFRVLPKTQDFFEEQERKLRRGDPEIARLYLPGGKLPEEHSLLPNEDLARTMELLARHGRDGFYRGPVAEAIVAASRAGGGVLTLDDFARYEARISEPVTTTFRGYALYCTPPSTSGAALFLPILKVFEDGSLGRGPLRTAENLDKVGRVWRVAFPQVARAVGDVPESKFLLEKILAPDAIAALREKAFPPTTQRKVALASPATAAPIGNVNSDTMSAAAFAAAEVRLASALAPAAEPTAAPFAAADAVAASAPWGEQSPFYEDAMAATTHFLVADGQGNIVCATQSQSLHFGAGVVAPGTGVVLNDSMSNFSFLDPASINYVAPGRRPRSTIAPTIVLRDGKPQFAIGIPGAARIPTALLQALIDRLVFDRPLAEAIGDTRFHFLAPLRGEVEAFEAEQSLPPAEVLALQARGWKVNLPEVAGKGRYFGGINAIEFAPDGTLTGLADPRRTNAAAGW